jgi:hypothetical protein
MWGIYSNESTSSREHALSLSNLEFQYGYSDVRGVIAEGMARSISQGFNDDDDTG